MPSLRTARAGQDKWFSKPHKRDLVGLAEPLILPGPGLTYEAAGLLFYSGQDCRGVEADLP